MTQLDILSALSRSRPPGEIVLPWVWACSHTRDGCSRATEIAASRLRGTRRAIGRPGQSDRGSTAMILLEHRDAFASRNVIALRSRDPASPKAACSWAYCGHSSKLRLAAMLKRSHRDGLALARVVAALRRSAAVLKLAPALLDEPPARRGRPDLAKVLGIGRARSVFPQLHAGSVAIRELEARSFQRAPEPRLRGKRGEAPAFEFLDRFAVHAASSR